MRIFKNLEEVKENIETITLAEADDCHRRLGIVFEIEDGIIRDASYEDSLESFDFMPVAEVS